MRLALSLLFVAFGFAQVQRSDRASSNFLELIGIAHGTATVSGNVTTTAGGVMTVNTTGTHGLVAGDRAVLTSCATAGLNAEWTIATAPTGTSFTVTGTGVNNANSASCSLQSFKVLASRTAYVAGIVLTNNSSGAKVVNVKDLSTSCGSAPCRIGPPKDLSVAANSTVVYTLPWVRAGSGIQISAADGTSIEYRIVGSY